MFQQIIPLFDHLPAWLLVFFRISGLFIYSPIFASQIIPVRIKVFLALGLSFCVYPALWPVDVAAASVGSASIVGVVANGVGLWEMIPMIGLELLIGIVVGYGAMIPFVAMQMAGKVIDQQMGLGLGGVFNPDLGADSGMTGQFYYILGIFLFMIFGGHQIVLMIVVESFDAIPLGGFVIDGELFDHIGGMLDTMMQMAFKIAAPVICILFLQQVAMGFIARTIPQMNILSIGFAIRIVVASLIVILLVGMDAQVFIASMRTTLWNLSDLIMR